MNRLLKIVSLTVIASVFGMGARAAGIDGAWKAEFDTQVGVQKYVFDFKTGSDGAITGKAQWDRMEQKGTTDLKDVKITGDSVSFVEPFVSPEMELKITYTGKISGDEMKLSRNVGDFATETLVAKRVPAAAAPGAAAPAQQPPASVKK